MAEETPLSMANFGASFKGFLDKMASSVPQEEPPLLKRLREHCGDDPSRMPILSEEFENADQPNLQQALDTWPGVGTRTVELIGFSGNAMFGNVQLSDLINPVARPGMPPLVEGPVQYKNVVLEDDQVITCVNRGLFLLGDGGDRLAVLVKGAEMPFNRALKVEVLSLTAESGRSFLREIRAAMRARNVYRGRMVTLSVDRQDVLEVHVCSPQSVDRDGIILPEGLLERIERQTLRFSAQSDRLRQAGLHLKRGLLLYGPPGTGKTLTAMYLASQMSGRTVLLLTGRTLGLIEASCAMARALQPSTLLLEDIDLIAEERTRQSGACNTLLFELLNQMDGLGADADVLFVLTTNRPDLLEPALAARPGRVDTAIEVPLPDEPCRRRLILMYGRGLLAPSVDVDDVARRTDRGSAAFIKELMRRAAVFAAEQMPDELRVERGHLDEALHDLLFEGGTIARSLLGVAPTPPPTDP